MSWSRPSVLFAAAALLFVSAFQLWVSANNPPGFHHDEASFGLTAFTIAHHLSDQDGARLPVIFPSYGDYKTATFSYLAAPGVLLFGPGKTVMRGTATALGILCILVLGWFAWRRAGPWVAFFVVCIAGLCPWLFQLGRIAYDTVLFPLAIALTLLSVDWWSRSPARRYAPEAAVGLSLAFVAYSYAAGRLLAVLLAAALVVFAGKVPWRRLVGAWVACVLAALPMIHYALWHHSGWTARYHQTKFTTPGMSKPEIVYRFLGNYVNDMNPVHWVIWGDLKPYVDANDTAEILLVMMVVAAIGIVEIVWHRRADRFWWFVLLGYVLTGVPAALTADRHDALRLAAMPAFLVALCVPGIELIGRLRRPSLYAATAVLGVALLLQWGHFVQKYSDGEASRRTVFEVDVPPLLKLAFGANGDQTVYSDHDDPYGRTVAGWYAVTHGIPLSHVVRLGEGAVPDKGSIIFNRTQTCDFQCKALGTADEFYVARTVGPNPGG